MLAVQLLEVRMLQRGSGGRMLYGLTHMGAWHRPKTSIDRPESSPAVPSRLVTETLLSATHWESWRVPAALHTRAVANEARGRLRCKQH